jgi:hypothetical protein
MAEAVELRMPSTTWVVLPITTFPKFIVDVLRARCAAEAACETPDNKVSIKAKTRALNGVRGSFTKASCGPHSGYMRRGIYINRLRSPKLGNIKQQCQCASW